MAVRTGDDYVKALRGDREVWLAGERIEDLPSHEAFASVIDSVAQIYDLQHAQDHRDAMVVDDATDGEAYSRAFDIPRTTDDLVARRKLVELIDRQTGGTMGRLPHYGAAFALGMLNLKHRLEAQDPGAAERVDAWFDHCRANDLSLATSFVDPQVDRSLPAEQNGLLHIVSESSDGVLVRGCKSVATFGPLCDEFLIITAPRKVASEKEVMYLSIPAGLHGLKFFCREPHGMGSSRFDRPLASRFDEPDTWAIFDDVLVPRDRVFFSGATDLKLLRGYFNDILAWPWFDNLIRMAAKADLLAGVSCLLSEYLDTWQFPQVQESVSDVIEYAETLRSYLRAAEEDAVISPSGMAKPHPTTMSVAKIYAVRNYPRMLEIVRELAGQGIIMAPGERDLAHPDIGPTLAPYYSAFDVAASDRIRLFRLAWDLTCDSFAGRQMLFELFNAGGTSVSKLGLANSTDKSRYISLAKSLAGIEQDDPHADQDAPQGLVEARVR